MINEKYEKFKKDVQLGELPSYSNVLMGDYYGVSEATIRRWKDKYEDQRRCSPNIATPYFDPKDISVDVSKAIASAKLNVSTQAIMVTADYHCPLYNPKVVVDMIEDAEWNGVNRLVIAGDFWNMDALSRFEPKQDTANLEAELDSGLALMKELCSRFEYIDFLKGNHDERVVKTLGYKMRFSKAMEILFGGVDTKGCNLTFSDLDYAVYNINGHQWRICHPQAYTQVPLSKGRILADKYGTNVITAHSHHFAKGWSRDGKKIVAELGGMFDASRTDYLQSSTTYPEWQNGYFWVNGNSILCSNPTYWTPRG